MVNPDRQAARMAMLLSFNGGYVDTAGFLALHGLFTAHVTGNFVTLGAALAQGGGGAVTKLLALPVFCAVILVTRLVGLRLAARHWPVLRIMLSLKLVLLIAAAALALHFGPFPDGDSGPAMLTGLTLVAAMAIQNAAHRIHLGQMPPTTLMTGTTTQIMIDVADMLGGVMSDDARMTAQTRLRRMGYAVVAFASGCAAAALLHAAAGIWCLALPPVLAAPMLLLRLA